MNSLMNPTKRLIALLFASCLATACSASGNADYDPVTQDLPEVDADHPPGFREVFIPHDGVLLTGFVLVANGEGPHPTVILLHGYPGNEKNLDLAQSMRRAGFNVLFFHYEGSWGSQGEYSLMSLAESTGSALRFLRENAADYRVDVERLSITGHSMGGFTAIRTAARDDDIVCVAGIAAANLGEYSQRTESGSESFSAYTDALFMLHGFSGEKALNEIDTNADEFDIRNDGPGLSGKSVMLIVGAGDTVVPPDVQERLVEAYRDVDGLDLTAQVIPGDHAFSTTRIELQNRVVEWLQADCD